MNELIRGCISCYKRKNIDKVYYTCTEKRSHANIDDPLGKMKGEIKHIENPIRGVNGLIFYCGCSCKFYESCKEKVEFT